MLLQSVVLENYIRLYKSNIHYFEWTPTKNLMLIIGSNGSGKSSVMSELSPLPSHNSEFDKDKGGRKEVVCLHKGSQYILKSKYSGKGTGEHSFVKDNVELNDGRTYQVQMDLVKQEFNLTPEILDMISGRTRFTQMVKAARQDWLTRMSPVDLGYAFDVLKRVTKGVSAQKSVIDHTNKRLANENMDMLNDQELTHLRDERKRMTDRVNKLFMYRNPNTTRVWNRLSEAKAEFDGILNKARELLNQYPSLPLGIKINDRSGFDRYYNERLNDLQVNQAVVNRLVEELESIQASGATVEVEVNPDELDELRHRVKTLVADCEEWQQSVTSYAGTIPLCKVGLYGNPDATLQDAFDRVYGLVQSIPENPEGRMSPSNAAQQREIYDQMRNRRRSVEDAVTQITRRIATLRGCEHVACPNCSHSFVPGVDPDELQGLEAKLIKASEIERQTEQQLKAAEEYLSEYREYESYVQAFRQIGRDHPSYEPLFTWMVTEGDLWRTPRRMSNDLIAWQQGQSAMIRVAVMSEDLKRSATRLELMEAQNSDAAGFMRQRAVKLQAEIDEKLVNQHHQQNELDQLLSRGDRISLFVASVEELLETYEAWKVKANQHAEWLMDQAMSEEISAMHHQLGSTENRLRDMETRLAQIRLLEETVEDCTDIHKDLQLVAKAMSPKGGLIGRYLFGFLQGVTAIMNAVIDEVWTYPMQVLPSKLEKDELDYKFPLDVENGSIIAPDISKGSDSQKEIVDFAFMMAQRKFMGYDEYPLYLDEFGRTFDEQHRANLVPFISRLIELGQVTQCFYISHFSSTHGAFSSAEYLVVDPTNVTVPEVYNKNVQLK